MFSLKIALAFFILFSQFTFADSTLESIDVKLKKLDIEKLEAQKKENLSLFLPEINLKSGFGSTKEVNQNSVYETTEGNFLYLDSKLNIFNGLKDIKSRQVLSLKIEKESLEKEALKNIQHVEIYSLLLERNDLITKQAFLKSELDLILSYEVMAKRKVAAGLTSNAELFDFEIKEAELNNESQMNDLKISEIESKIKNYFDTEVISYNELIKKYPKLEEMKSDHFNFNQSPSIKSLDMNQEIQTLEVQRSRNEFLPQLDLEIKSGQINAERDFFKNKSEHEVSLTLTFPLFSGGKTYAANVQSLIDQRSDLLRTKKERQNEETRFENQKNKLKLLNNLILSTESNLKKALSFQSQILSEYKRGIKDSSDLIESAERTFELKTKLNELVSEKTATLYFLNSMYQ